MDTSNRYREIVRGLVLEYAQMRPSHGDIQFEAVLDEAQGRYALMQTGWNRGQRVKGNLLYITIKNDQVYLEHDGVGYGISAELMYRGIPSDHITPPTYDPQQFTALPPAALRLESAPTPVMLPAFAAPAQATLGTLPLPTPAQPHPAPVFSPGAYPLGTGALGKVAADSEAVDLMAEGRRVVATIQQFIGTHSWIMVVFAIILFAYHASWFRNWIVDDGGITFSYARNIAQGHGVVSQPGAPPVEGYSNFLWTIMMVPLFWLGIFDPVYTPKLLGTALALITFTLLYRTLSPFSKISRVTIAALLMLLALNTSFVSWSTSGLENPLYATLVALLLFWSIKSIVWGEMTTRNAIILGVTASGIAMTRPDGLLYLAIYPFLLLTKLLPNPKQQFKAVLTNGIAYIVPITLLMGGFLAFRLAYFGELYPNTYFVKGGPSIHTLISILTLQPAIVARIREYFGGLGAFLGDALLALVIGGTLLLILFRRFKQEHFVFLVFFLCAGMVYLLLPPDWMGEFRFATPLILLTYTYLVVVVDALLKTIRMQPTARTLLLTTVFLGFVGWSGFIYNARSTGFAALRPINFLIYAKVYAHRFDTYADTLGLQEGSILEPDVGAALYYSRLRVYDLAGLTDKTIARNLHNHKVIQDYVFETVKPTFIHTHGWFTYMSGITIDERLRRDYIPIREQVDIQVQKFWNVEMYSGDYVRKDAVNGRMDLVQQMAAQ